MNLRAITRRPKEIDNKLGLPAYSNSNVDIFQRFGGLDMDNSFETLTRVDVQQMRRRLSSTIAVAHISTDPFNINQKLLELSEGLVNR
jgi:hypothetical protein